METEPVSSSVAIPEPTQSIPLPESKKSHGWFWGFMTVLVLIAGYAGAAYFIDLWPFVPTVSESPSPSPSADPTTEWGTYSNAATGFGFRYPNGMTLTDSEQEFPSDPSRRWVMILGESDELLMSIEINNPGRGVNQVADPVTGTVIADGVTITYQAGRILPMGETEPGTEYYWQSMFNAEGDSYIVEFFAEDGVDRTKIVRNILATFTF